MANELEFSIVGSVENALLSLDSLIQKLNVVDNAFGKLVSSVQEQSAKIAENIRNIQSMPDAKQIPDYASQFQGVADATSVAGVQQAMLQNRLQVATQNMQDQYDEVKELAFALEELSAQSKGIDLNTPEGQAASQQMQAYEMDINRAYSAMSRYQAQVNSYNSQLNAIARSSGGAANETGGLANETERAGNSARRGAAGWEKMLVSIKNIVFYRLVRGAIKALMNEVITGFQNLVQWSAKFQGTSGGTFSNFNKNVSLILSDMVMLKNAFAAAAEPIIGLLTPAIDWLITTLASAMNYLSAFLSMLTGRSTYTKAVKNVGNYAQSLNGASKAQKNFLAGFDELTTIPSQSGGASAGKNMGIDPSKMFVTEKIPEFMKSLGAGALMQNLTQFITDSLNKASDFIAKIDWQGLGKKLYDSIYKEIASVNWTALLESIFKFLGSAIGAVSGLAWGFIKDLFVKTIIPALQDSGNYFSDKIEECGGNIVEGILKGVTDGMVNIFNWVAEHIFIPFIDGFKNAFGIHSPSTVMAEMGGYIISGLLKGITDTIGKVVATIEVIKLTIKTKFWEMVVDAQSWGSQFISNIKNGISGGVYSVVNAVGNMNSQICNKIQELISSAWSWGSDFMQGFKSGIDSFINGVIDSVSGLASKIKRLLHFSSPDEGPLADYETWMPDFMKGLAQGINSNAYRVTDSIKALTDNMSGTFNVPVTGLVSGVSANVTGAATTSALQSQADSNAGMADVVWQAAMAVVEAVAQNKTTIQIGDDVIGKSAQRYNARAAMVNG